MSLTILDRVVEDIHASHDIERELIWNHILSNKIHQFENGIILEKNNEVHIHFLTRNWFEVKRCLKPILEDILTRYNKIDTWTDIPKAAKAITLILGFKQEGDRLTLTKEDFKNEFYR